MDHHNLCPGCMENKGASKTCPTCGLPADAGPESALHLPPGTVLQDKYLLGRALGQGGFGITYLAWDLNLNLKLAIKEYLPLDRASRATGQAEISIYKKELADSFQYGLEKYLDEARTLARFAGHPSIVWVRDFFKANGTAYIVMEYVEGVTLKEYLQDKQEPLPFEQALQIFMPVLDALKEVHAEGILHRDISPDNLLISSRGRVVLIDFGAARQAIGEQSRSLSVFMKPGFSPEEQYHSKGKQGPWTDIYALAASLYCTITGTTPPESLSRLREDTIVAPSKLGVRIDPSLEEALLKAMAVRENERYQGVDEFQKELVAASNKGRVGERYAGVRPKKPAEPAKELEKKPESVEKPAEPGKAEVKGSKVGLKEKAQKDVQAEAVKEPEKKPEPAEKPAGQVQKDAVWNKISRNTVKIAALVVLGGLLIFGAVSLFSGEGGFGSAWQRTYNYDDGSEYIGYLKKGLPHGEGTRTWPDGNKYAGEFKEGQMHGQGAFTFANGREYIGEFKADLFDGQGTMIRADSTEYDAAFKGDLLRGQGIITRPDGKKYVGEFKEGQRHGQGTLTLANGQKYVGEFKDNQAHGQGTYTWPDGKKYVGEFKEGRMHGQGTGTTADGTVLTGRWEHDEFVGP